MPVRGGELALTLTRGRASLVKKLEGDRKQYPLTQRCKKEPWLHQGSGSGNSPQEPLESQPCHRWMWPPKSYHLQDAWSPAG